MKKNIRESYGVFVTGGEMAAIQYPSDDPGAAGTWAVRVRPYVLHKPNREVVSSNKSLMLNLSQYAVDVPGSFRVVTVFLDVASNSIFPFGSIQEFNKVSRSMYAPDYYDALLGRDLLILADITIPYGVGVLSDSSISYARKGKTLLSSSGEMDQKGVSFSDSIQSWATSGLPGGLINASGEEVVRMTKFTHDMPKTFGGNRVGVMAYVAVQPIGCAVVADTMKYLAVQGPLHCSAADTACTPSDVGCGVTDTSCTGATDISVAVIDDGCNQSCEVQCELSCEYAVQSSCATVCECGHEFTSDAPSSSNHRCYWSNQIPSSHHYQACSSCDNESDPLNLDHCVSCDVACDASCQTPDTRSGSFTYDHCSGGSSDVTYKACSANCEAPPSCKSSWQTSCHACQTGCRCRDVYQCRTDIPKSGCVGVCSGSDILIKEPATLKTVGDNRVGTYSVTVGPSNNIVAAEIDISRFYTATIIENGASVVKYAITSMGKLVCGVPPFKTTVTGALNAGEYGVKSVEILNGETFYYVDGPLTIGAVTNEKMTSVCTPPTSPINVVVDLAGGGVIQNVGCPLDAVWQNLSGQDAPISKIMVTLNSQSLATVESRTFTMTISWAGIPEDSGCGDHVPVISCRNCDALVDNQFRCRICDSSFDSNSR